MRLSVVLQSQNKCTAINHNLQAISLNNSGRLSIVRTPEPKNLANTVYFHFNDDFMMTA